MTAGLPESLGFLFAFEIGSSGKEVNNVRKIHRNRKFLSRLSVLMLVLFGGCAAVLTHASKAEAALLDILPEVSVSTPVVNVEVPAIHVNVPVLEVETPALQLPSVELPSAGLPSVELPTVQLPVVELPPAELPPVKLPSVTVDIGPANIETPVVDIRLPDVSVSNGHQPPASIPQKEGPTGNIPDNPPTKEGNIEALHPADSQLPNSPALLPMKADSGPSVSGSKQEKQQPHRHTRDQQRVTTPSDEAVKTKAGTKPARIPGERTDSWPAAVSGVLTSSGSTSGGGISAGGGNAASAGSVGLTAPLLQLQPPDDVKLYYVRAHLYGANQWSKPPPVEPPRYTLLLR